MGNQDARVRVDENFVYKLNGPDKCLISYLLGCVLCCESFVIEKLLKMVIKPAERGLIITSLINSQVFLVITESIRAITWIYKMHFFL